MPTPTVLPPLVMIDPGHGGIDLGARHFDASGRMDSHESQVNLDIALRLRDLLVARGYRVLMTRDGDYRIFEDQDVNGDGEVTSIDEAQARIDLANEAGADLLLSIHQNAYERADGGSVGDVGGTVAYYCADRPFGDRSLLFAALVHERILQAFDELGHDVRDRGVWDDAILHEEGEPGKHIVLLGPVSERTARPSEMPGVLSETMFITHDREAQLARDPVALDRLALAYADAIDAYWAAVSWP
jgi:N-acetylmuramoyl-L-alanine amidase